MKLRVFLAGAAGTLMATTALAQGSLSGVGLGYPGGQLSARARATGGALGEFDPVSGVNPASLSGWERAGLFFQYEPEYRRTVIGGSEDWIRTQRFPLAALAMPFGRGVVAGITASSLLDRRWQTRLDRTETVGGEPVSYEEVTSATGAITDVRFGASWSRGARLVLGAGIHAYTGEQDFRIQRSYETAGYGTFNELVNRSYSGTGLSVGAHFRISPALLVGGSLRKGFALRSHRGDTATAKGDVPDRYAGSLQFSGVAGMTLGVNLAWTGWSAMQGVLADGVEAHDALEVGAGVEARGPQWFGTSIPVRAGVRTRTLPFTSGFDVPREFAAAAGIGLPIARGRAMIDFGAEWARRTARNEGCGDIGCPLPLIPPADVMERTWTFSFGVVVRQ